MKSRVLFFAEKNIRDISTAKAHISGKNGGGYGYIKGRPTIGSTTKLSHGKREALSSSPGWAMIFSSPVTFGGSVWVHG